MHEYTFKLGHRVLDKAVVRIGWSTIIDLPYFYGIVGSKVLPPSYTGLITVERRRISCRR